MTNMEIYDATRAVPETAQKKIGGGRLKGFTDINPMWRIQTLTELFGPCGLGWYVDILDTWTETAEGGLQVANVKAALYIKDGEAWSKPIIGIGGSMLTDRETAGLYTSDEAYKMAYTDALSVCCKMLGFGADIYWSGGRTKYSKAEDVPQPKAQRVGVCMECGKPITEAEEGYSIKRYGTALCRDCQKRQ